MSNPNQDQVWQFIKEDEAKHWFTSSLDNRRDVCKTMITTIPIAIGVFYSILQFLGISAASKTNNALIPLSTATSVVFLGSLVVFIFALQSTYINPKTMDDFYRKRQQRLLIQEIFTFVGTGVFVVGLGLAVLTFSKII